MLRRLRMDMDRYVASLQRVLICCQLPTYTLADGSKLNRFMVVGPPILSALPHLLHAP